MSTSTDAVKVELRKLPARAMTLKMDLHDLSEELPHNWERILEVATLAYAAFRELDEKRKAANAEGR